MDLTSEAGRSAHGRSIRWLELAHSALRRLPPTLDDTQEATTAMNPVSHRSGPIKTTKTGVALHATTAEGHLAASKAAHAQADVRQRYQKLAMTLESSVIPRLVEAHQGGAEAVRLVPDEITRFVDLLMHGSDAELNAAVDALHRRGLAVQEIFLQMFTPAARKLGTYWDEDRCDFSTVTVCLGRLQRLLRDWSPTFNQEHQATPNGRRVLLAQHQEEQHSFGLSMVAEFFRVDGWEVLGGVSGAVPDVAARVHRDWFDALGLSVGTEMRLDWLKEQVIRARAASRNRHIVVLVGGPLFLVRPDLARCIGADAACEDGSLAPSTAEALMKARAQVC